MSNSWHERWIVVVNGNDYHLDEKQAQILSDAIASGSRGIVQFDNFAISIPYIEEFYFDRKWRDESYQLPTEKDWESITEKEKEEQKELWERNKQKLDTKIRTMPVGKKMPKKLSQGEFEKRRQELLKQAKQL